MEHAHDNALLGGAIGADAMAGYGHDVLSGESAETRRTARLAQLLMSEESCLAAGLDPAAGSPFIETRTEGLAEAGWRRFQEIEAAGGLGAALASGMIEGWAREAARAREARLRRGDDEILGATLQPLAGAPADVLPAHADIRRPAAIVETLRRAAAAAPPRLLILRGNGRPPGSMARRGGSGRVVKSGMVMTPLPRRPEAVTGPQPGQVPMSDRRPSGTGRR